MKAFPETPGIYDLDKLSRSLSGKKFFKLKGTIEGIKSAGSSQNDLTLALRYIKLAKKIEIGSELSMPALHRSENLDTVGALASWAIILYTRATHSSSHHRIKDSILEKLTLEERNAHRYITKLRDDALAHFGKGPRIDKPWSKDGVVLRVSNIQTVAVYTPPVRTAFRAEVSDTVENLIERAFAIFREIRNRRIQNFFDEYNRLLVTPELPIRLANLPFDSKTFFEAPHEHIITAMMTDDGGDYEEGEAFYRPPDQGFFSK